MVRSSIRFLVISIALDLYYRIREICPYEPQTFLDIARMCYITGRGSEANDCYQKILGKTSFWDKRYEQIEFSALLDMECSMEMDLRISLQWNSSKTDLDLTVEEPGGELCNPYHNCTSIGGHLTRDFSGYGPEEYFLPKAKEGQYKVYARVCSCFGECIYAPLAAIIRVYGYFGSNGKQNLIATRAVRIPIIAHNKVLLGSVVVK